MQKYVLIHVPHAGQILLIKKVKPEWQKGLYNLAGGKIEEGETPEQAALRELNEETGMKGYETRVLGQMCDYEFSNLKTWHIWVVEVKCLEKVAIKTEEEQPTWFSNHRWPLLPIVPNLRVIIPLVQSGQSGWRYIDANTKYNYNLVWPPQET